MEELLKQILDELKSQKGIEPNGIYTIQGLADYLKCDYGVVLKWTKHGLKHRKLGKSNYILGKDILEFFDSEEALVYTEGSKDRIERKLSAVKYS